MNRKFSLHTKCLRLTSRQKIKRSVVDETFVIPLLAFQLLLSHIRTWLVCLCQRASSNSDSTLIDTCPLRVSAMGLRYVCVVASRRFLAHRLPRLVFDGPRAVCRGRHRREPDDSGDNEIVHQACGVSRAHGIGECRPQRLAGTEDARCQCKRVELRVVGADDPVDPGAASLVRDSAPRVSRSVAPALEDNGSSYR